MSIYGTDIEYTTEYRFVKHPRLEFKTGKLVLILPKRRKVAEQELIHKHKDWIYKKNLLIQTAMEQAKKREIINRSEAELKQQVYVLAEKFSKEFSTKFNKISFREHKSKWGSCNSMGNLSFNLLLRYLPDELVKYIVLHETTHLKHRKHNTEFWNVIKNNSNNYAENEKALLEYWFLVQDKIKSI